MKKNLLLGGLPLLFVLNIVEGKRRGLLKI